MPMWMVLLLYFHCAWRKIMYQDLNEDRLFAWWDQPEAGVTEPTATATRSALHPNGFSFLLPHPDAFWQTWLAFTSQELERLRFLRWRCQNGHASECIAEDALAETERSDAPAVLGCNFQRHC
jgi:hypothetical protein